MMRNNILLWGIFLSCCQPLFAQDFSKTARDAFLITRMADKFHLQPRPLNDTFSVHIFSGLLMELDGDKMFFTADDIKALGKYRTRLDDEIKAKKSDFLTILTKIFSQRIKAVDTMIASISEKSFDFSLNEEVTSSEMESYPSNPKAARLKLYKMMKADALYRILAHEKMLSYTPALQKRFIDSIEPAIINKVRMTYQNSIKNILQSPGGIEQAVGDAYCKAIAVCYDPHTEYFPLTEKENFESMLGQKTMAFGFQFKILGDGTIQIDNIAPGSPAFKSGQVNKGDKIESVQWDARQPIDVSNADWDQLNKVLELSNHGKATFKIKKPDGTVKTVMLWKEELEDTEDDNKVKSFVLDGNKKVGFISLPAFYQDWDNENTGINGCANDVAKEILKLKKEDIQGLILDLRYNGGGSVQEAVELAGIFLDAGPVARVKGKDPKIFVLQDVNRGTMYDGPLLLLVNGYSASASELVAGTLQDYNRALIMGSPTYGKATAQVILPLDTTITSESNLDNVHSESYLKVTVSQLYRVTGATAQATGVKPDILLPDLSETGLSREKDQPYVLRPSPVLPDKYFRSMPKIEKNQLSLLAKNQLDTSSYFISLKKYIDFQNLNSSRQAVSLKLSDAIAEKQKMEKNIFSESDVKKEQSLFSVENNIYEKQQISGNERLKEMNDQWATFLLHDPELQVAYNVMSAMIK